MPATGDPTRPAMRGGRRSGFGMECKADSIARHVAPEAEIARSAGYTRRGVIQAGAVLGGAALLAAGGLGSTRARAATRGHRPHGSVAIVGAGLAGIAAAYQLNRVGIHVQVFEARERLGGRCWTARGFADGQTAEHGGEFVDTRHVHLRQLARQLDLKLDDLWSARAGSFYPLWADGGLVSQRELGSAMGRISDAAAAEARRLGVLRANGSVTTAPISFGTAVPAAVRLDQLTMGEWLEHHVDGILGTPVGQIIDEIMGSWYGSNFDRLSAVNWIDFFVIPYPGGDERWHVHGGNDRVISRAAATLPDRAIHRQAVLRAIRRRGSRYHLSFDGHRQVVADLVILTLPFTTLRDVDYAGAGFSPHKQAAIEQLGMGDDSKVLVQYDRRPWQMSDWSASLESVDPDFDTWESSAAQPGSAGLITAYAGGHTAREWSAPDPHGSAPAALRDQVLRRINQAVPGTRQHFNGHAWADLWPHDPWVKGSYAAFERGQYTRFWEGTGRAEGNVHFAGEATSTYSQGFLNGGVESGDRAAIEVMRKLRVRVPPSLANLPYSNQRG